MRRSIRTCFAAAVTTVIFGCPLALAQIAATDLVELRRFDTNRNDSLSLVELQRYALRDIPRPDEAALEKALTYAESILIGKCVERPCPEEVPVDDAAAGVADERSLAHAASLKSRKLLWPGLTFGRRISDIANPRGGKLSAPFVGSLEWDLETDDDDDRTHTLLGAVQVAALPIELSDRVVTVLRPGIELDIAQGDTTEETSLSFAVPVALNVWWPGSRKLRDIDVSLTPAYITDQAFKRDAWQLALDLTFSSPSLGFGYITPRPTGTPLGQPGLAVQYRLHGIVEVGDVIDANNNTALMEIMEKGAYVRAGPRLKVSLYPNIVSPYLRLWGDTTYRVSFRGGGPYPYVELGASFDIAFDGAAQLTALYRWGDRAPALTKVEAFLIGIGLQVE